MSSIAGVDIGSTATLFITDDASAAIANITTQDWARSQWFPSIFLRVVVGFLAQFIIAYEHVLHFPIELSIWYRLIKRRTQTKAILPWSTLWLRYHTLALGILSIMIMWDQTPSALTCRNRIYPTMYAFAVIVSVSTGSISAWRSRTVAKAALSSRSAYNLVQMFCFASIFVRLASQIVAYSMQIEVTRAIVMETAIKSRERPSLQESCFARAVPIMNTISTQYTGPVRAYIALLAVVLATDLVIGIITFICLAKLKKIVPTQNHLLDEMLRNSIEFFSLLAVVDIFALAFYCITKQSNVIILMVSGASILMIRVLIKEQECFIAHYHTSAEPTDKTAWNCQSREGGEMATTRQTQQVHQDARGMDLWQSLPAVRPGSSLAAARGMSAGAVAASGSVHIRRGHCGNCCRGIHTRQTRRKGAGLTDIDKVTVLEHGRSVDRPWPTWEDDGDVITEEIYAPQGDTSAVKEWVRQTARAAVTDDEKEKGGEICPVDLCMARSLEQTDSSVQARADMHHVHSSPR